MRKYRFENGGKEWVRVTKKIARAAYNAGLTIMMCPVKMRPFTPWHLEIYADKSSNDAFDTVVNGYEYYNCNSETERYSAFYVENGGATV